MLLGTGASGVTAQLGVLTLQGKDFLLQAGVTSLRTQPWGPKTRCSHEAHHSDRHGKQESGDCGGPGTEPGVPYAAPEPLPFLWFALGVSCLRTGMNWGKVCAAAGQRPGSRKGNPAVLQAYVRAGPGLPAAAAPGLPHHWDCCRISYWFLKNSFIEVEFISHMKDVFKMHN